MQEYQRLNIKNSGRDFTGSLVIKTPPCNAGNLGSTPDQGIKTPHAEGQLSPCIITKESLCSKERSCMTQQTSHMPQLRLNAAK